MNSASVSPLYQNSKFMQLTEALAMTLLSRFLNHLELIDTINTENTEISSEEVVIKYDSVVQGEHADAVMRNLVKVGQFLGENEDIRWVGNSKRTAIITDSDVLESTSTTPSSDTQQSPMAFIVLMDKICKIGRKASRALLISTCLKLYATLLLTCPCLTENIQISTYEPAYLSILKLIDHVQTFTISRDQVRGKEWRSTLELAGILLDRIKNILGEDQYSLLNLRLVKSMSVARLARREEKRQMVLTEPELAAKLKSKENQKKYQAKKRKTFTGKNGSGKIITKRKY